MNRRSFVFGLLGSIACRHRSNSPVRVDAPSPLRAKLVSFCTTIRHRQWEACIHFFAPQHLAFQHKIYFSPDYNESPPDPDDPTERARFRDWYLRHTLGLSYVDNHLRTIDQVRRIEVMDLNRPHGPEGPLKAVLAVSTRPGQRDGWFYVDPVSLHFFGSYG